MTKEQKNPPNSSYRTPYNEEGSSCERTYVELRIYSQDLSPSSISAVLQLTPTGTVEKGKRLSSAGKPLQTAPKLNGWFLSTEDIVSSLEVRQHLDCLLEMLFERKTNLRTLQAMSEAKMNVTCIWWARGDGGVLTLWPKQMQLLSDLNLELQFAVSFYGSDQ